MHAAGSTAGFAIAIGMVHLMFATWIEAVRSYCMVLMVLNTLAASLVVANVSAVAISATVRSVTERLRHRLLTVALRGDD